MLFVVIELSPRVRFNPFRQNNLFQVYNEIMKMGKESRSFPVSYYSQNHYDQVQAHMDKLTAQFNRFILLNMLVDNRYGIPKQQFQFNRAIRNADFHFGALQRPLMPRFEPMMMSCEPVLNPVPRVTPAARVTNATIVTPPTSTPFAQIPKPDSAQQTKAAAAVQKLGERLPEECRDPISTEPLTDPIEINKRVYNRETVLNLVESDGKFKDPFNRERVFLDQAKAAHYMLDAIIAHEAVVERKEKPAMLMTKYENTNILPLKELIEQWGKLLSPPTASAAFS